MIKTVWLVTFTLSLLLTGCDNTPRLDRLSSDAVILAFGDSLTYGTGAREDQSYPAQLETIVGRQVINAGVPGEVTATGRNRLSEQLDQHQPALLVLCHGGNDMLRRQDRAQTVANLKAMIDEARHRNIAVVLLSVPQLGLLIDPAPFYSEIAAAYKIPCENEIISDILATRGLKSDTIHPNAAGYKMLAESIAKLLHKSGAI